jgi:hypothetical protein
LERSGQQAGCVPHVVEKREEQAGCVPHVVEKREEQQAGCAPHGLWGRGRRHVEKNDGFSISGQPYLV